MPADCVVAANLVGAGEQEGGGIGYTKGPGERVTDNCRVTEKRDRPDANKADQMS